MTNIEIALLLAVYILSAFTGAYRAGKVFAVERDSRVFMRDLTWYFVPGVNTLFVCFGTLGFSIMYSGPIDQIFPMSPTRK